ncbi:MAG: cytochrome c family protein [Desulfobacula sp.]|nr:cytochrome c family protein [Desulfobacula sp.]
MDTDKNGSYILLSMMLILVLFFIYCSIPKSYLDTRAHKLSKKTQTKSDTHVSTGVAAGHGKQVPYDMRNQENLQILDKKEKAGPETVQKTPGVEPVSIPEIETVSGVKAQTVSKPHVDTSLENKNNVESKARDIDIIVMNNPLYDKHKKGIVQFAHKAHIETYAIGCGECHHDDAGKPLDLSPGDDAQGCIECHKGTKKPKGEKLDKKTRIMTYHFEALHANCISCHKTFNIEKGDPKGKGPAPTSCTKCHPKK